MRRNNKKKLITSLVLLLILSIGIVYAYLTSNLSITGATEIAANTWDIHFENIQITDGSVVIDTGGSAATVNPSDDTEVTYSIKLNRPGDFYEFTVDVKNDGTLDGMIESISSTLSINNSTPIEILSDNSNLPAYLDYSVTYSDDIAIEPNHELKAGNKETYKVRVEYKKDIIAEQLPQTNSVHLSFGLRPIMVQANKNAVTIQHATSATTGNYLVTTTIMYLGGELYSTLEPEGVALRNSPDAAMNDWKLITGDNSTRPFYIKFILENVTGWYPDWDTNREYFYASESECLDDGFNLCVSHNFDKIKESYVEFIITNEFKAQWKAQYCNADNTFYESIEACEATYDNLVNGTYTLRGGVDESGLEATPIYDANVEVMKEAFNYTTQPDVCHDSSGFNCYVVEGLSVAAQNFGYVDVKDNITYGCVVYDDGRFGCEP